MLDFVLVSTRQLKNGDLEIYPKFKIMSHSSDLMIRGGDFYAVWDEKKGIWSTDEQSVIDQVDDMLQEYANKFTKEYPSVRIRVLYLWDSDTMMIDKWHKYCQRQMRDHYNPLDEKLIFANDPINKSDYSSKRLSYPLVDAPCPAWDELINVLYSPEEVHKIEWAIGAIVSGDSKDIQKFEVLYGAQGTGKGTVLNIIQKLFAGYCTTFDAKALGSNGNSFALEPFRNNPLVAIQGDGDLSRIEDNTRLNSLVSHELMVVNEKFKATYQNRFKCFLFMGTNKPVKITDGKSGLLRRLIDVHPTGVKIPKKKYKELNKKIDFELGAICNKCLKVYTDNPDYYDAYVPMNMVGATNDFYNFIFDNYYILSKDPGVSLTSAWAMYKEYCEDAKVPFGMSKMKFKEEMKNYYEEYLTTYTMPDGTNVRGYFKKFKDISESKESKPKNSQGEDFETWISLKEQPSILDDIFSECQAQYEVNGRPECSWDDCITTLKNINTKKTHYVMPPNSSYIFIDFDKRSANGEKDLNLNILAANMFPPTYAEVSKSGNGLHLYYIYDGDVNDLSNLYSDGIEIKKSIGKSPIRRKLTLCNNLPIATLSSGLPLKEKKIMNKNVLETEKTLRTSIEKALRKEVFPSTKQNIDFINYILNKAYENGIEYDVSNMINDIYAFANQSTNNSDYCRKIVHTMKLESKNEDKIAHNNKNSGKAEIIFLDVEVFPNLTLVCWKFAGDSPVVRMYNPSPDDIANLLDDEKYKIIGFNNRQYDNHILYALLLGYNNEEIYNLSYNIINSKKGDRNYKFKEAYSLSYTDIYDFAATKQSLKKWEIALHLPHKELPYDWTQPIPEDKWDEVGLYCENDVRATEAVFNHLEGDFKAREILAALADMTPNDTTNTLTTKIIFGNNRNPQLNYVNLEEEFPGYEFKDFHNMYRGVDLGFGGYVYAEPGIHENVALIDIESMHPSSIIAMNMFGEYTKNFADIKQARVLIKRGDLEEARHMLDGKLSPFLDSDDKSISKALAQALKIAINSVYGLTSASFDNPFKDPRNVNNIVALRGALFMKTLLDEVQAKGYKVVHIKTDSIKIANADKSIIDFCLKFAEKYKYKFVHEASYSKICLVNDAVYIAKYMKPDKCKKLYDYIPKDNIDGIEHSNGWTATGTQFAVPFVFKTLFSKEPLIFDDFCETKQVSTALYLSAAKKTVEEEQPSESDLIFIGKVGLFCPIKPESGGMELLRKGLDKNGNVKFTSATGAKGYKWLEADAVAKTYGDNYRAVVDDSYYISLANKAIDAIDSFGGYDRFISDEEENIYDLDTILKILNDIPWKRSCGKDTCNGCEDFRVSPDEIACLKGYDISDIKKMIE